MFLSSHLGFRIASMAAVYNKIDLRRSCSDSETLKDAAKLRVTVKMFTFNRFLSSIFVLSCVINGCLFKELREYFFFVYNFYFVCKFV